ncbi:L-asparaginase [Citrobacter freundii]|nr:L-asparaginase [Citrobacter freundii]PHZ02609.1 L-asparaginase [Citrobacter freundii]
MLFAILPLGSAHNPHVLHVRCGCSALSADKLAATITLTGIDS